MNNKKQLIAIATICLGMTTLTAQVQAQEIYNQPFSGSVSGTYTFDDVSDGQPEPIISSTVDSLTSTTDGNADFSVALSVASRFSVGLPQQIDGPAITANIVNILATATEVNLNEVADSNGATGNLPSAILGEFDVGMSITYDQPLVPGNYLYIVPITFTPQ